MKQETKKKQKREIVNVNEYQYKETDNYWSYGFRIRENLPFTNGQICRIFMGGAKAFRLIGEKDFEGLERLLENDPQLYSDLEQWTIWNKKREEGIKKKWQDS